MVLLCLFINNLFSLRIEFLVTMAAKISDFWHVTNCRLIEV
jgi:hypothetical protein